MSRVAVRSAEAEREKLLWAMALVAGRRGYPATSVAEVIAEAESCRAAFERHFADKEACFAAAMEMLSEAALAEIRVAMEGGAEWAKRLITGLARAVELCEEAPGPARAVLACSSEAGAVGARCRAALIERLAELAAPEAELANQLPPRAALMAVGGVAGLIGEEMARGEATDLAALAPELGFALLAPMLGPVAAGEEMARVGDRAPAAG